jgi:hypothetical protein
MPVGSGKEFGEVVFVFAFRLPAEICEALLSF